MTASGQAIVETDRLTRRFGATAAADEVTLSVCAGEIFGLLGANGAGKTTVIKMLATLLPPTAGDAWVAGASIRRHPARVRRAIGYVPQAVSVDGALTGYENLLIFAKLYGLPRGERRARVDEALASVALADEAGKLVRDYSGGMIRRLELAQSTLHRPAVLFLDEPTVGLDPAARLAVWQHLVQLRRDHGTTILFTTHLMDEAEAHCDRVALMQRGKKVAVGTCRELRDSLGGGATLDDVFLHYAGGLDATGADYRATARERGLVGRLG